MNHIIRLIYDRIKTNSRTQKIGAIHKSHACMTLSHNNEAVTFPITSSGTCVLELDELHCTAEGPFSYLVLVNGQTVYQRTMEPMSDSICPCLVKLLLKESDTLTLRLVSGIVNFSDIFLHTDLEDIMAHYLEPMEIGLCFPRPTYTDRSADLAKLCKIRDDFADLKHFTVAVGIEVKFMQVSDAQLADQFDYILDLAREAKVNLIFNFNSWWDGTPVGRDGKGGYFGDLEYQQIIYDPLTGEKKLSIPNLWRNTPWYTMNHDHLNMVRKTRLAAALDILGKKSASLKLTQGYLPTVRILIDNEPTYWAEFAYSSSPEAGGDFNEHAIRAAQNDGVDLNPAGELRHDQKLWLLKNLCTYMTDVSETYHACTSDEYAVVAFGQVSYGNHHLAENVMSHVQAYSGHPYADEYHMRHEEHVNPYTRLGVETCGHQDERTLSYFPATGRFAQVNAERCCYSNSDFHHQFYAHGAFSDIIFNFFYDSDVKDLHQLDHLDNRLQSKQTFGTEVMRFSAYNGTLTDRCIVSVDNLEIGPLRERRILRPATLGTGSVTFDLGGVAQYPYGGWVELKGLIRPLNGSVTAALGTDPNHLTDVQVLPEWDADHQIIPLHIPMDTLLAVAESNDSLYLKLTFDNLYYDDWAQMNAVWEVRAVAAFERYTTSADNRLTLSEARALSTLISYRIDCMRLTELFPGIAAPSTEDYKTLYQELMHRISISCTNKFFVSGVGFLEKYNLHINSGNAVIRLHLKEHNDGLIAELQGKAGSNLTIHMDGKHIDAEKLYHNCYLLKMEHSSEGNSISIPVEDDVPEEAAFVGTYMRYDTESSRVEVCTHDSAWGYQSVMQFNCPADTPVTLTASKIAGDMLDHISTNPYTPAAILNARIDPNPNIRSLNPGDMILCRLIGDTVSDVSAVRGLARGRITAIEPLSMDTPMHNPFITVETAPNQFVTFELGMNTHLNYQRAHAENPVLAGNLPLELAPNNIVLINFEPETIDGRPYRALEITMV